MLWSNTALPGRPTLLIVDASANRLGWEAEFADRLFGALHRRGMAMAADMPVRPGAPDQLAPYLEKDAFNCLVWLGRVDALRQHWEWLRARLRSPKLIAVCTWEEHDAALNQAIASNKAVAAFAIAPQEPVPPRAAGLFLLKFFVELDLHAPERIDGKTVWFAASKARELLKRRRLDVKITVRT